MDAAIDSTREQQLMCLLRRCGHFLYHQANHDQQSTVLTMLEDQGPVTQKDIRQQLGVKPGSASELISKLEAKECLVRSRDEADRRKVVLTLTEKGRRIARFHRARPAQTLLSGLTEQEQKTLTQLLCKLLESWGV